MNKLIATLVSASMLIAAQSPAFAQSLAKPSKPFGQIQGKSHGNGSAKIAAGLALGAFIVGAAIASRAHAERGHHGGYQFAYAPDHGGQCRVWRADCRYGSERACYKYETRC